MPFENLLKWANGETPPARKPIERITVVDPFIDEETKKQREILQETRERVYAKLAEENEQLESMMNEIIMDEINKRKIDVDNKILQYLVHYLMATKKQRGWTMEKVRTAASRIMERIKLNESLYLTSPNYYHLEMQLLTEDLY